MTPTEMEDAIRNLQQQADRIEQFLPNLATRGELVAQIQDAKRHAVILNEATRDQIRLLAEHLARIETTMATKEELREAIGGLEGEFKAAIGGLEGEFKTAIGGLEVKLNGAIGAVRQELKGAIGGLESEFKGAITGVQYELKAVMGGLERQIGEVASHLATRARGRKK
jgi:phage-related protein